MHLADAFIQSDLQVHSGYTILISMCVPWESNPQPFALLTQCSTTEPQEQLLCSSSGLMIALSQVPLNCWAVFYPRRATDQAEELVTTFTRVAGPMGMRIERPIRVELRDDRTETFVKSIHSQLTSEVGEYERALTRLLFSQSMLLSMGYGYFACVVHYLNTIVYSLLVSAPCAAGRVHYDRKQRRLVQRHQKALLHPESCTITGFIETIPLHFLVQFLFV